MPFDPDQVTLPITDQNGDFLPGCSERPTLRLASMMWHLAARGEADRLQDVLIVASRQGVDWGHRGARNGQGASPLFIAAQRGHSECLSVLLRAFRHSTTSIDGVDNFGNSPLTAAVCRGRVACVRLLLDALANPNHSSNRGYSCIEVAVDFARVECASLLLQAGASPERPPSTHAPSRPSKHVKLEWECLSSLQEWRGEPTLPGQTRRARELMAQITKHAMIGPDTTLLETPLDRFESVRRRHAANLELAHNRAASAQARQARREQALGAHYERVNRAAMQPRFE